jgi:hypothetical protein
MLNAAQKLTLDVLIPNGFIHPQRYRNGPGHKTLDQAHRRIDTVTYVKADYDIRQAEFISRQALRREGRAQDAAALAELRKNIRSVKRGEMLKRQRERELNRFYTGPAVGTMLGVNRPVATLSRAKFR